MIKRRCLKTLERLLDRSPAVVMLGARQSGKTTLARAIAEARGAAYFDLESDRDRARLNDIEDTLGRLGDKLVVLEFAFRATNASQATVRVATNASVKPAAWTRLPERKISHRFIHDVAVIADRLSGEPPSPRRMSALDSGLPAGCVKSRGLAKWFTSKANCQFHLRRRRLLRRYSKLAELA